MKIRGNSDNADLQTVKPTVEQDAVRIHSRTKGLRGQGQLEDTALAEAERAEEKVNLALARAIKNELDPEGMAAERRQRVSELKKLVQSGQYNPPASEVARAIANEISTEILLNAGNDESVEVP